MAIMKQPNRVLGLDLSLTGTGWCATSNLVTRVGIIEPGKLEGLERMDHILKEISKLLDLTQVPFFHVSHSEEDASLPQTSELNINETLVIIEDFSFSSKGSSLFQIAGLGYLVRHWLWEHGIKFLLVPPTMVKKFCTGTGTAQKSLILKEVYKRWNVDLTDDNEADAYVLSRIGRAYLGWDKDLTAFQRDVIDKMNK
jgi:hypothetical protein